MQILLTVIALTAIAWGVGELMALCYNAGLKRGVDACHRVLARKLKESSHPLEYQQKVWLCFNNMLSAEVATA